ncbi:NADPH-dependent ferric siderophore reductase [Sediminihabitans luteus]|uniref:NADPH-dependent ferric siderophore reductase n=1 Tax=Sediminihabitans luteus TaxID=1138585 RepID=A0A2M9CYI1_9CELL|nr:siderophore-interacting protein [Sediminihabitans luteus]PJJ76967.1 NADPH-dependent ferric siderophore reductase [Sediminihabitans luteus]GII99608.1 siderophore-interacting protein [Sediminihabitans luteus]
MAAVPGAAVAAGERAPRGSTTRTVTVRRTRRLTPHMVRLVLGGDGLDGFAPTCADAYVKLLFGTSGAEARPVMRTYTVRDWDAEARELTIDFVVHGDEGLAGPWADAARPGDTIDLRGPGGTYDPSSDAPWHLLVGDDSALPALAVAASRVPAGARVLAVVEVGDASDEQALASSGELEVVWAHRTAASSPTPGVALVEAVARLGLGALAAERGVPQVFLHGEAGAVRTIRRALRTDGLLGADASVSGYWRLGRDDEGWRAEKRDWQASLEQDDATLTRV